MFGGQLFLARIAEENSNDWVFAPPWLGQGLHSSLFADHPTKI